MYGAAAECQYVGDSQLEQSPVSSLKEGLLEVGAKAEVEVGTGAEVKVEAVAATSPL